MRCINRKAFLVILAIFSSFIVYAQPQASKQANFWFFGQNAGIDFNGGATAITTGSLVTSEGCSAISDSLGNLLFYSDGSNVWNANHNTMPNGTGLLGCFSATQSCLIIPKPGSDNIYYVVTLSCLEDSLQDGLRYSEVDMTLNGGLGDVTATKNVLLHDMVSEKLTAVYKSGSNCNDIWLIAHDWGSNDFLSYSVTNAGINTTPIVSSAGTIHSGSKWRSVGAMKISPNGRKLATTISNLGITELYDYDPITGIVSNSIILYSAGVYSPSKSSGSYGLEFSPDGTKLYTSPWSGNISTEYLYQYNVSLGSAADIIASKTAISPQLFDFRGALQLGPDGKIYQSHAGIDLNTFFPTYLTSLSVINNPNALGVAAGWVNDALSLSGRAGNFGLPNIFPAFFIDTLHADFIMDNFCVGDTINFINATLGKYDSLYWDFGDSASGAANNSTLTTPSHLYTTLGSYDVTLSAFNSCENKVDTIKKTVFIEPDFTYSISQSDTVSCLAANVFLNAIPSPSDTIYSYQWTPSTFLNNDTISDPVASITVAGIYTYYVDITKPFGCTKRDTISINISPSYAPLISLSTDTNNIPCGGGDNAQLDIIADTIGPPCDFQLDMFDSYGDNWNGASMDIYVNGVNVGPFTHSGGGSTSVTFPVTQGDSLAIDYSGGTYPWEESYELYDGINTLIFSDGPSPSSGIVYTGIASCGYIPPTSLSYSWSPLLGLSDSTITNPTASPLATTTYAAIVTDTLNGCSNTDSITINVSGGGIPTVTPVGPFCQTGDTITLTTDMPGGVWAGPGITDTTLGIFNPTMTGGPGTFSITYTISGVCTGSDSINIIIDSIVTATTIAPIIPSCFTNTTPIPLTSSGTSGGAWSGSGVNVTDSTFIPSNALPGGNTITYIVSSVNGVCNDTSSIVAIVDTMLSPTITLQNPLCEADATVNLSAVNEGVWSGIGITDTVLGIFNPAIGGGDATYTITNTVTNGACLSVDSIAIIVDSVVTATIIPLSPSCITNTTPTTLFSSGTQGGTWSGTGVNVNDSTFTPSSATVGDNLITYTITSTSTTCTDIDVTNAIVKNLSIIASSVDETCKDRCDGNVSVIPSGTPPFTIIWSDSTPNIIAIDSLSVHDLCNDIYSVTVRDSGNVCSDTKTATVFYPTTLLSANFTYSPQPVTIANTLITLRDSSIGDPISWVWTIFDTDSVTIIATDSGTPFTYRFPGMEGIYPIQLEISDGCNPHSIIKTIVIDDVYSLYVPTAFTPNGDGINDVFFPQGGGIDTTNFSLFIYDRWGELIFEGTNISTNPEISEVKGWNGTTSKSKQVPSGVYVWKIISKSKVLSNNDTEEIITMGRVTLLR